MGCIRIGVGARSLWVLYKGIEKKQMTIKLQGRGQEWLRLLFKKLLLPVGTLTGNFS